MNPTYFCYLLACLLATPLLAHAATLPDLDAVISYESHSTTRSGVSKQTRFQEHLIRRNGHIWTEPVRARFGLSNAEASTAEHAVHAHFDFEDAARLLSRDADGRLQLDYVDASRSTVVRVPPGEYEATGFTSSWDAAATLIEPAALKAMPALARRSPVTGARWYQLKRGSQYTRLLWSATHKIALKIESGNQSGSSYRSTTVKLLPTTAAAKLPWLGLEKLPHKEYDDFMD